MNDTLTARDAIARARMIAGASEAQDLYERAALTGDTELADAISREAALRGWSSLRAVSTETPLDVADRVRRELGAVLVAHKTNGQQFTTPDFVRNLTVEGRKTAIREFTDTLLERIADLHSDTASYAQRVNDQFIATVTEVGSPASSDATEALLFEMRATKAWDRVKSTFKGDNAFSHLTNALEGADAVTVSAILTEGPSWLVSVTDDSRTDFANALRAAAASQNPRLRRALTAARLADQIALVTRSNVNLATRRLQQVPPTFAAERARTEDELLKVIGYIDPITTRSTIPVADINALLSSR